MVTGIEIAGIALAVFPIVLNGLSSLCCTARKIKNLRHYRRSLGRVERQLDMERGNFVNTCTNILGDMATEERLSGSGWKDLEFQERLKKRLGRRTAKVFRKYMRSMISTLDDLRDELELDKNNKPALLNKYTRRKLWKKIKFVLDEREYCGLLDQIHEINTDLDRLVLHQIFLNSIKPSRQTRVIKSYIRVREHAIKLHKVFREKFDADHLYACSTDHNVCLLLRGVSADKKSRSSGTVRFSMLFAFDSWHKIVFELVGGQEEIQHDKTTDQSGTDNCDGISVVDEQRSSFAALVSLFKRKPLSDPNLGAIEQALRDTTAGALAVATGVGLSAKPIKARKKVMFNAPPPESPDLPNPLDDAEKIENLCLAIHEAMNTNSIRVIAAEEGLWWRLCPADSYSPCYLPATISLDSLLERGALEVRDRLKLGVTLATAMMQLHTTKWLGENGSWGKRDILFPQGSSNSETDDGEAVSIRKPIIENPFLRQVFSTQRQETTKPTKSESLVSLVVQYDRAVFSLGIVLIELWVGKRLEDLPEYPQNDVQDIDIAQYLTANLLMDKLREQAGHMYGDAVRRCIKGLDHPKRSLNDKDFKTEVQAKVVVELERNWKAYIDRESQEP